jgi:tripartite ATP-independent transporter DctP family solute receptor
MNTFTKAAAVSALSVTAFFGVPAQAETVLQLASVESATTIWGQAAQKFADGVAEASGGEMKVELALSSTTGTVRETLEALTIGTNDIVLTIISSLNAYDALPAIESYPYLIRDADHFANVFNGPVGAELYDEIANRTGFRLVGAGARGAREMASKKPINSVEDLAGLKIRVPNIDIFRSTWETLGASPTPMSSKEVYTGLQSGIIDAAENPLSAHLRSKYYEAADYVIMTDHVYGAYTLIFDQSNFDRLTAEEQTIIKAEGQKAMAWGTEQETLQAEEHKAKLTELGATIIEPDLAPFRAKAAPMLDAFPDLAPWVQKIQAVE